MWMENFGAVGNFLWKKTVLWAQILFQQKQITQRYLSNSQLRQLTWPSCRRIFQIWMSDLSPLPGGFLKFVCWLCLLLLGDFSSLFADLPAVEQYCSGLRRKVGEFCIILSHLPSLLQTLSYFYLSPQMLTRLAFQVEGYLVTPIFRFVGELQVQFWLSWSSQSSLQLQWSEVTSSSLQNHNWVQLKITVGLQRGD